MRIIYLHIAGQLRLRVRVFDEGMGAGGRGDCSLAVWQSGQGKNERLASLLAAPSPQSGNPPSGLASTHTHSHSS